MNIMRILPINIQMHSEMSASIILGGLDNLSIYLLRIYTKLRYKEFFDNKGRHDVPKSENYM